MDIKVLRNFVEIVESGSLTAASKKLFIAQPALSNQLKAIEKEMNSTLIERNSRHQKLTDSGRLFYERAKTIILLENSMTKEIRDCESGNTGCLKLATIPSCEIAMLTDILPGFLQECPDVKFEFYEKESDYILQLLEDGTVDIGIIRTPCNITPDMDVFYISDEQLVCAYRSDLYHFQTTGGSIPISELGDFPVVIIRRYEKMFRDLCANSNFIPNIRNINQQLTLNIKWAEVGLGVAIVPKSTVESMGTGLEFKEIGGTNFATRRAIVTMKNTYHSRAVKNFLALCKEKL